MNSSDILDVIDSIAAEPSKTAKLFMLGEHMSDPTFVRVLRLAYDPFITFGVATKTLKSMVVSERYAEEDFSDVTWAILDQLADRDLSGSAAFDALVRHRGSLNAKSDQLLCRILLKDLRAGFSESSINKAASGTIPDFPYMRCSLPEDSGIDDWDWSQGHISQEKADGMFANLNVDSGGHVWVTTRQGSPFPVEKAGALEDAIKQHLKPGTQTHGELLVVKDGLVLAREIGNGHLNSLLKGGDLAEGLSIVAHVWDQIPLTAVKTKGSYSVPYHERLREVMLQMVAAQSANCTVLTLTPTRIVRSRQEANEHCAFYTRQGKEGTIVKRRNAIWKDGTSKDQVKFKVAFDVDLEIVGFEEGKGKNASTFGSIICASGDRKLVVSVSGFTDKQRKEIHDGRDSYLGKIMTVRANNVMTPSKDGTPYSLFLPRWVEFRADKQDADTLERVQAQLRAAMGVALT